MRQYGDSIKKKEPKFKSEEYWTVDAELITKTKALIRTHLINLDGKKLEKFDLCEVIKEIMTRYDILKNDGYELKLELPEKALIKADKKARRGKKNTYGVKLFDKDRDNKLLKLHEDLKSGNFKTSEYSVFKVYEPKEREIFRLPYYPDRIVHHAIMNILEPIWTKIFPYNTYSCIKGRGITGCKKQVEKIIDSYKKSDKLYCLKIDIKKYYPSVDHDVLKSIIRRKFKDKRLLNLLDEIIDSGIGLPVGNYLSQYLSNLYLCYFMHYVNEVLKVKVTEYADDICFFSDNKSELHEVYNKVKNYLEGELKLTLKSNYQIFPISYNRFDKSGRALDYLGFKFYRNQVLLRRFIKCNLCKRLNKLIGILTIKELRIKLSSYIGWIKYSNSKNLFNKLLNENKDLLLR